MHLHSTFFYNYLTTNRHNYTEDALYIYMYVYIYGCMYIYIDLYIDIITYIDIDTFTILIYKIL